MKVIDGIELLRKYRDGEIDYDTKIKSISVTGNEYYMHIGRSADKILHEDGSPVSTGYLTNIGNTFEIIEEEKDIEEIDIDEEARKQCFGICIQDRILANKINELVRELNKIKKEGK